MSKGVGTGWDAVLWFGSLASLLGGIALDCSEFSGTPVSVVLYAWAIAGWLLWLIRKGKKEEA